MDKQIELQTREIKDLNRHIDRYNEDIERLTNDKELLIERLNDLSISVTQKMQQIEQMEMLLADKDKIIEIMTKRIKEKQVKQPVFTQPKGDTIDQMLGFYINQTNCPVPIRKLGNGYYLFGTKKIYAKILNGKLVIRVGGGYMIIEEFIATYADAEMAKIAKLSDEQLMALAGDSQEINTQINPNARISLYRNNTVKNSAGVSATMLGKPNSKISGTSRTRQVKN